MHNKANGYADWNTKSSNSESINGEAMPSIPWYKKTETAWNLDCQRNLSLLDKWFRALNLPKACAKITIGVSSQQVCQAG
jgi:hypothetical protein